MNTEETEDGLLSVAVVPTVATAAGRKLTWELVMYVRERGNIPGMPTEMPTAKRYAADALLAEAPPRGIGQENKRKAKAMETKATQVRGIRKETLEIMAGMQPWFKRRTESSRTWNEATLAASELIRRITGDEMLAGQIHALLVTPEKGTR